MSAYTHSTPLRSHFKITKMARKIISLIKDDPKVSLKAFWQWDTKTGTSQILDYSDPQSLDKQGFCFYFGFIGSCFSSIYYQLNLLLDLIHFQSYFSKRNWWKNELYFLANSFAIPLHICKGCKSCDKNIIQSATYNSDELFYSKWLYITEVVDVTTLKSLYEDLWEVSIAPISPTLKY